MKIKCPITSDNLMKIINIQFECKGKNDSELQKEKKKLYYMFLKETCSAITALQLSQISCLLFDAESGTSLVQ